MSFRFSLRTMLVGFAVLALPLAWVAHNASLVRQRSAVRRSLTIGDGGWMLGAWRDDTRPGELSWIRRLMGDWPLAGIRWDQDADQERVLLDRMHRLFPEADIVNRNGGLVRQASKSLREKSE